MNYFYLLTFHSIFRWVVFLSLIWAIVNSYLKLRSEKFFSKSDNALRHWTATFAHIQLIIGVILYIKSPIVKQYWKNSLTAGVSFEPVFFSIIHIALMILAVVVLTIGSALAKRKLEDSDKFKTILLWFGLALLIILVSIPWPFSPLAQRPYLRY
jgi:drug/metabolite transporter (DMT)-like permease